MKVSNIDRIYETLLYPILSKDKGPDAECLSQIALKTLSQFSKYQSKPLTSYILRLIAQDLQRINSRLSQELFGCNFRNPIGIAAGFDKDGIAAGIWEHLGFGFAELGTITWHAQSGNKKPRLFRLAKEKAALNRMGFNNRGARVMRETLEKQNLLNKEINKNIFGLNIGKSKITPLEEAAEDYASSLKVLTPLADYIVINVSSPNTPGLRELQEPKQISKLIKRLREVDSCPPLLVKIAPDLSNEQIDELAIVAIREQLEGLIAVNTSLDRLGLENRILIQTGKTLKEESGGLSGRPLQERAQEVISRLYAQTNGKLPLIGVGGIDSPQSAWELISAGASLIQIYTGWIYEGPGLVPRILDSLLLQLDKHGFKNISEAVGSGEPWIKS